MAERTLTVKILGDSRSLERAFTKSSRAGHTFSSQMKTVTRSTGGFSRGFLSGAGALSSFGGALALTSGSFFAGAGLVAGLKAAVSAAGDFQQTMSVLQQVSGATADQMKAASAEARRLGADITLPATSATDAAVAMQQLAKGGLTIQQALGAARGTLQLAAAAQTDVGTAANTTARALTAFGLSGSNAGAIADALANAANAATGDITDFAIGLSQSGQSAHQFGLTAQDTVTALTELARAGLVGSDAGTSLRVMLGRLLPASKQARDEIRKLGITVHDARGNFLPFPEIIEKYNRALSGLTPAQRQSALQTIFGTDAQRAANIILGTSVEKYNDLYQVVTRQGGAARAAAAQQRGFKGALDGFNSALQTTEVTIGTELLPALTRYLRSSAKWLGDSENQARIQRDVKETLRLTGAAAGAVSDAFRTLKTIVSPFTTAVGGLKNAFELLIALKVASTMYRWAAAMGAANVAATGGIAKFGRLGTLLRTLTKTRFVIAVAVAVGGLEALNALTKKLGEGGLVDALKHPTRKGPLLNFILGKGFEGDAKRTAKARVAAEVKIWNEAIADGVKNIQQGLRASREPNPRSSVPGSPTFGTSLGGASVANAQADVVARVAKITAAQRNTFFDNAIARILLRGGLGSISAQIAALQRANSLIAARIKVTKDVTRRLNLEDQLLQNAAQIKSLRAQAVADALQKREEARQRLVEQLQKRQAARVARQFRELGLNALGEERTPGVGGLKKRLQQLTANIAGTNLDTPKLRTQLARFRKVLSEGLVPKDVRAKIKEMMDGIADELKNRQSANMTKFRHVSSDTLLAGLGLNPQQLRLARSRLSQVGVGGTVPGVRSAAFAGAGAVNPIDVHTTINLDGQKIAVNTTRHQQKRRSVSRRG